MSQQSDLFAISKVFFEIGYAATSSVDSAMRVMAKADLNEDALARTLSMMVRSHSSLEKSNGENTWNVEHLVEAVHKRNSPVSWTKVMIKLDHPEFAVYDLSGLKMILDVWYASQKESAESFPVHVFFTPWQNARGQLSILYQMLCAPPDVFNLTGQAGITKVIGQAHIMALNVALRPLAMQLSMFPLNCMEMINAILNLGNSQAIDDARFLLDRLTVQYPELLLLGLAQLQTVKTDLYRTLLFKLLNIFLIGHANSPLVITLLMKIQPGLVIEGFLDMYSKDPTTLPRILDIAQETKILVPVLRVDVPLFVLDLAALAARRQHLNLEKWLSLRLKTDGIPFSVACIDFLQKKCADELRQSRQNLATPTLPLSGEVLGTFFRVLSDSPLTPQESEKLWKIMQFCSQLQTVKADDNNQPIYRTPTARMSTDTSIDQRPLAAEAEELVRAYFVKLYVGELSPEDYISVLKKCHESSDPSQSEFFACTIHTLLDEARFFNQYPDGELRITGKLFGLLIEHHLITHALLQHALKHILDALNSTAGSKLFHFGVYALAQFQSRLSEWPQYTMLLSKLPALKEYPAILNSINAALDRLATSVDEADEKEILGSTTRDDTKVEPTQRNEQNGCMQQSSKLLDFPRAYDIPPDEVQEKVAFTINNLTMSNMDEKVEQLEPLLNETIWGWFSHYLVVRRVSIERNNHDLYAAFLTRLDKPGLFEFVIEDTYRNIQILLQSESTDGSQSDRDTLKTLGTWLGKITLSKNKPIRHKDLSFKDLLLDCYDRKRLIVAIPLTCRVLQEAQNSKIFKPPNPWLMGILKLLAELYWHENLSLKLKFEVEILYRALGLDLNEIEPTNLLERRESVQTGDLNGSSDAHIRPSSLPQPPDIQRSDSAEYSAGANTGDLINWSTALTSRLQFSPAILRVFEKNPATRMGIFRAITESLKKVVPSAVATTANIAAASTRSLILKDFASDPDELKVKRAALTMVRTLAARLAVATCKEPLCNFVIDAIRAQLVQAGVVDTAAEEIGTTVALDNLNLMDAFIEQQAQMRAISEVERLMAPSYSSRKLHNEQRPRDPYFDVQSLQGAPHNIQLPEPLRSNRSVNYEQVSHVRCGSMKLLINFLSMSVKHLFQPRYHTQASYTLAMPFSIFINMLPQCKLLSMLTELDGYIRQPALNELPSFKALDQQHVIYQYMRHFLVVMKTNPPPLKDTVTFIEKVVLMLFENNSRFALETYTVFLQALFELYPDIGKEVIGWFIYADDERKYNAEVTAMMMLYDLIPYEEYDVYLSKLIRAKADGIMDYAAALLKNCLLSKTEVSVLEDHILTVTGTHRHRKHSFLTLISSARDLICLCRVVSFMNELEQMYGQPYGLVKTQGINYLELRMLLAQWIRLNVHPLCKRVILKRLASKITLEVCKSDELQSAFVRLCVQTAIQQYLDFSTLPPPNQYRMKDAVDSVAKLIAFMMAAQGSGEHEKNAKVKFFTHALSIVILVLVSHHEAQTSSFDQRPFLRLLCSISIECNREMKSNELLRPFRWVIERVNTKPLTFLADRFFAFFSEVLYTIRPAVLPGFAFSWLQLISHRTVLSELLAGNDIELWKCSEKLVVALLKFLGQLVEGGTFGLQSAQIFYRSALRMLVVLLHDFPEFLSYHYITFISAIPFNCVQIRNLVLSAFPRTIQLPDPSGTDGTRIDLPEFNETPAISPSYVTILNAEDMLVLADQYLRSNHVSTANGTSTPPFFEAALKFLKVENDENTNSREKYHIDRLEALVLYVGTAAISSDAKAWLHCTLCISFMSLTIIALLGRYFLLNVIADHIRYPNKHTYFFKSVILYLFSEQDEMIKENITRTLLERLIVNRPHPWGILATFIELLHTPNFWKYKFIHAAPEFQRLFENVLR
ncbi:CCR4-Not complex component, Not1-domain-containing protein [Dichotomocladium elegans]|nr:CCR4-Not complex component, Not1-domain-containing protein [Dichotomocladium elegans]